jgi:hypothetical protein
MKKIWTYWEGPRPPYIDLCLESFEKMKDCGYEVTLVTPNNVAQHLFGTGITERYKRVAHVEQRSDIVRVGLLHKYGGMWFDADTVMLNPPENLAAMLDSPVHSFTFTKWEDGRVINGYIGATPNNPITGRMIQTINKILGHCGEFFEFPRAMFGEILLDLCLDIHRDIGMHYPRQLVLPYNFNRLDPKGMVINGHKMDIHKALCFGLNHSHFVDVKLPIVEWTKEQCMTSLSMVGEAFRYAFR